MRKTLHSSLVFPFDPKIDINKTPLVNTHLIHILDFPETQFYVLEDLLACSGVLSVMLCVYRDRSIFSLSLSICEKGEI